MPATVASAAGINSGLVSHYQFDGDFKDASGQGNDGTKTGNVAIAAGGAIGQCAEFKGGYLSVAASSELNLGRKLYNIRLGVSWYDAVKENNDVCPIVVKLDNDNNYLVYNTYVVRRLMTIT